MTAVLVVNAGSSTLKWAVLRADGRTVDGATEPWVSDDIDARAGQLRATIARAPGFDLAGHRVVHGGSRFRAAVVIDEGVRDALAALVPLDPEHMQPSLAGIDAVRDVVPSAPQVAAFDTAFHATLSQAASVYGLPFAWTERWSLRRFGFHGLSVAHAVGRTRELLGALPRRLIVCHLGSGCSITAVRDGCSVDTTMGFTPIEGPMMATRSGSIDPGLLLYLQEACGVGVAELRDALTHRSGLAGVSGVSGDLRAVLDAASHGSSRALLAYDCFALSLRRAIGAMLGVLGGVDAIAFTGGVGENSARVRRDAAAALEVAGVELAADADESPGDRDVSAAGSRVRVLVIRSREDLVILDEVLALHPDHRPDHRMEGSP